MVIELTAENEHTAETLVSSGRFSSIQEAVQAGLSSLILEGDDTPWSAELQSAVDEGAAAAARGDVASDAEVDALFSRYQQH